MTGKRGASGIAAWAVNNRPMLIVSLGASLFLFEAVVFNLAAIYNRAIGLKEQRYSVEDGSLHDFQLVNHKLLAEGADPNVTFDNLNLPIAAVSISCTNSEGRATGQVFYRGAGEPFIEARSIRYPASLHDKTFFLNQRFGIPLPEKVASLRLDLTDTARDALLCRDLVVNPLVPFKGSALRFSIYAGLFLLGLLFVLRDLKSVAHLWHYKNFYVPALALLLYLGAKLLPLALAQHIAIIVILCVVLFSVAAAFALKYVLEGSAPKPHLKVPILRRYRSEIALAAILLLTTLPLLTGAYFYYDDWWILGNSDLLNTYDVARNVRPLHPLFLSLFDNIGVANAYILKWAAMPAVVAYAVVLYRWLRPRTRDSKFSLLLAASLTICAPMMDALGYGSVTPLWYSILFSALSVICFERAFRADWRANRVSVLMNGTLALTMILVSLLIYQVGVQFVFVLLTLSTYFQSRNNSALRFNLAFLAFFALANGLYLLFVRLVRWAYHIEAYRSQMIGSFDQVVSKVAFYASVVTQSAMQVIASLTGGALVAERYRGYYVTFWNPGLGNALILCVLVVSVMALVHFWGRHKSVLDLLSLLAFVPLSFFVFLILQAGGYLTYYASAHISLFMFYFIMGAVVSVRWLWGALGPSWLGSAVARAPSMKPAYVVGPLLVVCAFVSNYYLRDFYVDYNSAIYEFVTYSLQPALESSRPRRIHVYGLISPINADVYSRFVVETALKDLDEVPSDYQITFSRNRDFMVRLEEPDYLKILGQLAEKEKQELEAVYVFDPTYRQYSISAWPSEEQERSLQRIFTVAGAIPQPNSADTLTIDLSWTDEAYTNERP